MFDTFSARMRNEVGDEVKLHLPVRHMSFGVIGDRWNHRGVIESIDPLNRSVTVRLDEPMMDVIGNPIKTITVFDPEKPYRDPWPSTSAYSRRPKLENLTAVTRAFDEAERDAERAEKDLA